jgi:aryl-alcohol dehydrogenase-like predicted oxidoreductase
VVATKGGHLSTPGYRKVDRHLSPPRIAADLDDSLARLDADVIDLYWLHRDDPRERPGDVVETLNAEVRRGRIRYFGASNWPAERIDEANRYAHEHGLRGFVANQPEWSLAEPNAAARDATLRFLDQADRAWHAASGVAVVPYTPTAGGFFATAGESAAGAFENPVSRARLARVVRLAGELGRPASQIALAYLTSHEFPVFPIIGTTKVEHLRDAVAALEVRLTAEQIRWLRDG